MSTARQVDIEVENDDTFDAPVVVSSDTASTTQSDVSREIAEIADGYQRAGVEETQPRLDYPPYRSSLLRHPTKDLQHADPEDIELWSPCFGERDVGPLEADLTIQHDGEPQGQRIVVHGRVRESGGRAVPDTLVEIWQCNAAGRYRHVVDQHPAPLDPNFSGGGRCVTDREGRFRFITIKPGAYPWGNHHNAWRPAHIHFSVFGRAFVQRLVTQMYFPADPLFFQDPIYNSVPEGARERMICRFDLEQTIPEWALAFQFDIVLRGREATPMENE